MLFSSYTDNWFRLFLISLFDRQVEVSRAAKTIKVSGSEETGTGKEGGRNRREERIGKAGA